MYKGTSFAKEYVVPAGTSSFFASSPLTESQQQCLPGTPLASTAQTSESRTTRSPAALRSIFPRPRQRSKPPSTPNSSRGQCMLPTSLQSYVFAATNYECGVHCCISRKVDFRMLPLLGLLYSVALIDRVNLASARTAGMGTDLVSGHICDMWHSRWQN